jgi:hypothetical protein
MTPTLRAAAALALALSSAACNDTGRLAPIEPDPEEIDDVVVCDGATFGELKRENAVTEDCRARVERILPDPSSNFDERLVLLGSETSASGARVFYLHGAGADGQAVSLEAWESSVRVEINDGTHTALPSEALEIAALESGDAIHAALVSDHSESMRDEDLDAARSFASQVFAALPDGFEASVTQFSSNVVPVQPFTSDREALQQALLPDPALDRRGTALYDAMASAILSLLDSHRPIRLLFVLSDGPDNASREYRRADIAGGVGDGALSGLVGGALYADDVEFRSLFAARGSVFHAPSMTELPELLPEYLRSLRAIVKLTITPEHAQATSYRLVLDELSAILR